MKFGLEKVPWSIRLELDKIRSVLWFTDRPSWPYLGMPKNRMYLAVYDPWDTGRIVVYGPYTVSVFNDVQNRMLLAFYDPPNTGRVVVYGPYLTIPFLGRMLHSLASLYDYGIRFVLWLYGPYSGLRSVFNNVANSSELRFQNPSLRPQITVRKVIYGP